MIRSLVRRRATLACRRRPGDRVERAAAVLARSAAHHAALAVAAVRLQRGRTRKAARAVAAYRLWRRGHRNALRPVARAPPRRRRAAFTTLPQHDFAPNTWRRRKRGATAVCREAFTRQAVLRVNDEEGEHLLVTVAPQHASLACCGGGDDADVDRARKGRVALLHAARVRRGLNELEDLQDAHSTQRRLLRHCVGFPPAKRIHQDINHRAPAPEDFRNVRSGNNEWKIK